MGDKLPAECSAGASEGLYGRFLKQARKRGKGKALPAFSTLSPFRAFQARLGASTGLKRGLERATVAPHNERLDYATRGRKEKARAQAPPR